MVEDLNKTTKQSQCESEHIKQNVKNKNKNNF